MPHEGLLKESREEVLRIAAKHGAHNVRVFGSVARGDAAEVSDGHEWPRLPRNRPGATPSTSAPISGLLASCC